MVKIVAAFLRHGDYRQPQNVPSAHLPFPLTAEGEMQARRAADLICNFAENKNVKICPSIDSSNLLRGWQTATAMSAELETKLGEPFSVDGFDDLAERGLGSAANMSVDEIEAVLALDPRCGVAPPGWKSDSHYRLPLQGAESLMQAGERVAFHVNRRMEEICRATKYSTLKIFVGHGAAFRHAAACLGALNIADIPGLSMFHCRPVFFEVTEPRDWRHIGGEWKVRDKAEIAND